MKRILTIAAIALSGLVGMSCAPPSSHVLEFGARPERLSSVEMGRTNLPVYEGIEESTVDLGGAAWWAGSAELGEAGTTILLGHRTSHGGPFRNVSALRPGSSINLTGSDGRTYRYEVVGTRITEPTWEAIRTFHPSSGKGLILVACHPLNSTAQRIVIDAELVEVI